MSKLRTKYLFIACLTTSLVVSGCVTDKTTQTEAPVNLALQTDGTFPDPMQAHAVARKMVNPKDTSQKRPYTITEQQFAQEEEVAHEKLALAQQVPKAQIVPGSETDVRLSRLENQVSAMHQDFKQLQPSISEANAQALATVDALDKLAKSQPPVPETKPDVMASAQQPQQPEQISPSSGMVASSAVTDVRIGEHPGKTRIVLDMTAPGVYSANLDNARKVLEIALPQSAWSAAMQQSLGRSAIVKGYKASQPAGGGVILDIELKGPARLLLNSALPPNDTYGNRIAFDVAPL